MAAPTPPSPASAVFLSYAREDSEAARRIAEALRTFGIEVWFDQNELRGGDTWDSKIRTQIKSCALFLPLVSRQTEERAEGYFRREWKLAVDRTHDMATGRAFIVPVVIDDTPESGATVPEEFLRYQWTRLEGGVPSPDFVAQVKRLLDAPRKSSAAAAAPRTTAPFVAAPPAAASPAPPSRKRMGPALIAAAAVVAVVAGFLYFRPQAPSAVPPGKLPAAPSAPAAQPAVPAKSIAVLPFANLSADKENEFFADGVHDDVITSLAKIRDLTVISRTSVLAYRDTASRNLKRIAAELGVANVLEGSVRRAGTKVQVNAQLIDARTDAHLWAETFSGDASDIFALQAKLAQEIAGALKTSLTAGERTLIERRPTSNPEAYALFVQARARQQEIGESRELADYDRVVALFERASELDPTFALAYSQAVQVHLVTYWFGHLDPSPARRDRARAALDAAVRLAPEAPETHMARGAYHYRVERDWARALAEFTAAERHLPNDAQLAFWLAVTHRRLGRWTDALKYFERSLTLNPRETVTATNYTAFLSEVRRYDQARAVIERALAFFPGERDLLETRAQVRFALDGDTEAVLTALASLATLNNSVASDFDRFRAALLRRDWTAADQALAASRVPLLPDWNGRVIQNPKAFYEATVAFLRGDRAAAGRHADRAIAAYAGAKWNERQIPWVKMRVAAAHALAGRTEPALHEADDALADISRRDVYDTANLRLDYGTLQLLLGRRDEALETLRIILAGPCSLSSHDFRLDPFWSQLSSDPRFEEILKNARPL